MENNIPYLIAIHRCITLTTNKYHSLKTFFNNDFEKAFTASISDWSQAGLNRTTIEKFFINKKNTSPQKEIELLEECGAKTVICEESNLFLSLKNIHNAPVILFIRGEILETDFPSISVVGSRKISSYGKRAAYFILEELVRKNITIVSGLAYGTDELAHKIALDNGGRTIAILGNGIDEIYPKKNQKLGEKIIKENRGALISEYLPGTKCRPENFPIRNRIVAGLSKATILIEAALRSGTLITARLANEMGRDVFAIPGEIFSKTSKGTNQLIYDGSAQAVLSGESIIEILNFNHQKITKQIKKDFPLSELDKTVLQVFDGKNKLHIDDIYNLCPLENSVISSTLVLLEMKGIIYNLGNQTYDYNY